MQYGSPTLLSSTLNTDAIIVTDRHVQFFSATPTVNSCLIISYQYGSTKK